MNKELFKNLVKGLGAKPAKPTKRSKMKIKHLPEIVRSLKKN